MRISELNGKDYLGAVGVGENSYVILNYKEADPVVEPSENENENEQSEAVEPTPPITYKVTLDEIGRRLINDLNIVTYDTSDGKKLKTIKAGDSAYSTTAVGEFINATDRTAIDSAITDLQYDTTNKKFVKKTYNDSSFTDIVSTANILNDMNLNITQITNTAGKTVATIDEADGKVSATFQDISILSSQVSDKSDAINSNSTTLATSKAVKDALESLDITQITNTAGKTVATIDEADGKVSATFQDISITSNQISDRGTAGCVATLDANGHVPSSQLPSYVDDVLEGHAAAPVQNIITTFYDTNNTAYSPEDNKIYVDTIDNISYRWSGSQYVKIASDLSLGDTSSTACPGDRGKFAFVHAEFNPKAMEEALLAIDYVNHAHVYCNFSNSTVDNIPAKSILAIVDNGSTSSIVQAIKNTNTSGLTTTGSNNGTVDNETIYFTRASLLTIRLSIVLTSNTALDMVTLEPLVKNAVMSYINNDLDLGEALNMQNLHGIINQSAGNIAPTFEINDIICSGSHGTSRGILYVNKNQKFQINSSNDITVTNTIIPDTKLDANQGSGNVGKYMKVGNDGALAPADLDELPAVTSSDNDKFLCVVNGVWAAKQMQTWQGGSF